MKKLITIILSLFLITMLSGCEEYEGTEGNDVATVDAYGNELGGFKDDESSESNVDIDWTTATATLVDNDGYEYQISYKLSPWMLLSDANMGMIQSAWNSVEDTNELLGYDDWELNGGARNKGSERYFEHRSMTDMYYCIGSISVENKTEGWSITPDKTRNTYAGLNILPGTESLAFPTSGSAAQSSPQCIGAVSVSSGIETRTGELNVQPLMQSDIWGPAAFIIMVPENLSPNNPEGANLEALRGSKLYYHPTNGEGVDISLDVYGKDGEFYESYN